jgi:hypothetical protein
MALEIPIRQPQILLRFRNALPQRRHCYTPDAVKLIDRNGKNEMKKLFTNIQFLLGIVVSLNIASAFAAENTPVNSQITDQVRPQESARYELRGDTVYDTKTKLTWARCSVGQQWQDGKGCVGDIRRIQFPAALALQKGHWRLPTKDELSTLIDDDRVTKHQMPSIDVKTFPDMSDTLLSYWSSTTTEDEMAWMVYFRDGSVGQSHISAPYAVRLVQSDK